ncbi:LLM class F420-dependent oxidoreductase [Euzebya sp.]|uniref:LLM class F420-dependent oxidoreductase n=1 Tax=Euzebya sp. TaxID=1971409 RepID=UPI00351379A6
MRLGLNLSALDPSPSTLLSLARRAEELGYDSVWTAEGYGTDAVVPLSWVGAQTERIGLGTAIMQIPARTPASTAMTATALDLYSHGRLRLGLGVSGPQVVEGWHGQPFARPLERTREYVEIVRAILARDGRVSYRGAHYQLPYGGQDATGLGVPLKLNVHPRRPDVPIYLAALGPKNVALALEIADGWLPVFLSPQRLDALTDVDVLRDRVDEGFDLAATVNVVVGDDLDACRDAVRPLLALYIGGMGAKGQNYYNSLACRYGYEAAAARIQDAYLDGRKHDAAAAVPDALVDEVALCGPPDRIRGLLEAWRSSLVTSLLVSSTDLRAVQVLAELEA